MCFKYINLNIYHMFNCIYISYVFNCIYVSYITYVYIKYKYIYAFIVRPHQTSYCSTNALAHSCLRTLHWAPGSCISSWYTFSSPYMFAHMSPSQWGWTTLLKIAIPQDPLICCIVSLPLSITYLYYLLTFSVGLFLFSVLIYNKSFHTLETNHLFLYQWQMFSPSQWIVL